jgi:hypothetical protein
MTPHRAVSDASVGKVVVVNIVSARVGVEWSCVARVGV